MKFISLIFILLLPLSSYCQKCKLDSDKEDPITGQRVINKQVDITTTVRLDESYELQLNFVAVEDTIYFMFVYMSKRRMEGLIAQGEEAYVLFEDGSKVLLTAFSPTKFERTQKKTRNYEEEEWGKVLPIYYLNHSELVQFQNKKIQEVGFNYSLGRIRNEIKAANVQKRVQKAAECLLKNLNRKINLADRNPSAPSKQQGQEVDAAALDMRPVEAEAYAQKLEGKWLITNEQGAEFELVYTKGNYTMNYNGKALAKGTWNILGNRLIYTAQSKTGKSNGSATIILFVEDMIVFKNSEGKETTYIRATE